MKRNLVNKVKAIYIYLYIISTLVSALVIILIKDYPNMPSSLKNDVFNVLIIGFIVQTILFWLFIMSFRRMYAKELTLLRKTITDITKGNYVVVPESTSDISEETQEVFDRLLEMKDAFLHFDNLKKEKIIEHRNRILAMLNMTDSGFIIFNMRGNIVYLSDIVQTIFPSIEENTNIISTNYHPEIENSIKKIAVNITKTTLKSEQQSIYFPSHKRHITVRSNIIRDASGVPIGFILCLINLMTIKENGE